MFLSKSPTERQRAAYEKLMAESQPEPAAEAQAAELVSRGFVQRSNKYRIVAGLPPGETGLSAVERLDPEEAARLREAANRSLEYAARQVYLTRFAQREGNEVTLDLRTFAAFKRRTRLPPPSGECP